MDYSQILNDIEARRFKPVYLFDGEETYYMDHLTHRIEALALQDHERDFNQFILYAQDVKPEEVASMVKRYPIMAERQLIIVKEIQQWRTLEPLESIFEHVVPSTILVLNYRGRKLDGRNKIVKLANKVAVVHTGIKLGDWDLEKWIANYAQQRTFTIEPAAISLLGEQVGSNIVELAKSFDKFDLYLPKNGRITTDLVSNVIGISKEYNVFEYQKALGSGQSARALKIANYFAVDSKDNHVVMIVSSLFRYFSKLLALLNLPPGTSDKVAMSTLGIFYPKALSEFRHASKYYSIARIWRVIDILYDIELKSKGVKASNANSGDLVKELTVRILYESVVSNR